MKKLNFEDIKEQQLIDVRTQHDYQARHVENSLNLNPGNLKKYANDYLDLKQPIVFIIGTEEQSDLAELSALAEEVGFAQITGYLFADEIPAEKANKLETISVDEFLNKEDDYILLDVRHPDEITRPAPEKNLVNIPFEDLITDHTSLHQSKEIYTLCGSGNRSTAAASYLLSKGFNPIIIKGGMKAIQAISQ